MNNGIFLCEQCAEAHKKLGSHYSDVKSLSCDNWTDKDLRMMELGTNDNYKNFMKNYSLLTEPAETRYKSQAADYYRRKVRFRYKRKHSLFLRLMILLSTNLLLIPPKARKLQRLRKAWSTPELTFTAREKLQLTTSLKRDIKLLYQLHYHK